MRHIAFLIPTLDRIAGAEQQVILLAQGFAKRGRKVSVIALSGTGGEAAGSLHARGTAFLSLHMRKGLADPRGWIRLYQWIQLHHPDVFHAHLPHAALLARWLRSLAPMRVFVDTLHTPATGGIARRLGYTMSAGLPDATTAVSRVVSEAWLASGAVHHDRLVIIPNGVDTDHWRPDESLRAAMRCQLRLSGEFLWLATGRLEPVKDHANLLRAFAKLPPKSRLIIAGTGSLQNELQFLAGELGLTDRVLFSGFEPNVLPSISAADGFVHCSRWEGLPMALLEASACQLPSVITNIPGALEALPNPRCSFVANVGNADALAEKMNAVMRLPEPERRTLGLLARQGVMESFSLHGVLDRWEDLFSLLLEQHPHPSRFGISASSSGRTLQLQ